MSFEMVEWECILDCNFKCSYCVNSRNSALKKPIMYEKDFEKIKKFIDHLKTYNVEIFIFGGEPFLHPRIEDIIKYANTINLKYMIQTNFSMYKKIQNISEPFILQVSFHREQVKNIDEYIEYLKINNKIRKIDIMFKSLEDIKLYNRLIKEGLRNVFIAPVADFTYNKISHLECLANFNKYKKILRDISFEPGDRSFKWEAMIRGESLTKGKPCIYKNKYILFDPLFRSYNCSHRINCDICPNNACFLQ